MFRKNYILNKFFLLPFVRIWLLFLLVLSFTDHDHYVYIGNDYKSAAVEAIAYDHIDFPLSTLPEDSRSEFSIQKHIILPFEIFFKLYAQQSIPFKTNLENFQKQSPSIITLLNVVIQTNAP